MKNNRIWWERRKLKITIASTLDGSVLIPLLKMVGCFVKPLVCADSGLLLRFSI